MFRSYPLRIRPNKAQVAAFTRVLSTNCDLYNAALQERRDAWRMSNKSISYRHQQDQLTELHHEHEDIAALALDVARDPLRRVDLAFKAFFRRVKAGEKPGYPRFRAKARYDSFTFGGNKPSVSANHIRIPNIGLIRFKTSRPIVGKPKTATVRRVGEKWEIRLACDIGAAPAKRAVSSAAGIDVGLMKFVTLSDGTSVDNPRWTKQHAGRIAKASRSLARKKRGSKNRAKARETLRRAHQRAADARRNFTHHVSKVLVAKYDLIAFEDLNIAGMAKNRHLSKSILDAAWGELIFQLKYKAEKAGVWTISVNPRGTSQGCSRCGDVVRKTLAERTHNCSRCGLSLDRDHNAALNILRLGESLVDVTAKHTENV
jgi:putative transposase